MALYAIAQWAVPLLKSSGHHSPSFFATSSHFPEQPMPILLSLSVAKAAQQNLLVGLHEAFGKDIHFGVIKVCGPVSESDGVFNPENIARTAVELFEQEREDWRWKVEIR